MEAAVLAGTVSTALFAASNAPMLVKAARTRNLASYSLANLVLANVANGIHTLYVLSLPAGPIWALHGFYVVTMAFMLVWYVRFVRHGHTSSPAAAHGLDALVHQHVEGRGDEARDLAQRSQAAEPVDEPPYLRAPVKHFATLDSRRLAAPDHPFHEVPVVGRGSLQVRVVSLGDKGPVREIVNVGLLEREGPVSAGQGVQPRSRVLTRGFDGTPRLGGGGVEPGARHGCKERPLTTEVDVWGLMADPGLACHIAYAQSLGGNARELLKGHSDELVAQRGSAV